MSSYPGRLTDIVHTIDPQDGYSVGQRVRVDGREGTFEVLSFVENVTSGDSWIDLWGGPARRAGLLSVTADRLRPTTSRR